MLAQHNYWGLENKVTERIFSILSVLGGDEAGRIQEEETRCYYSCALARSKCMILLCVSLTDLMRNSVWIILLL